MMDIYKVIENNKIFICIGHLISSCFVNQYIFTISETGNNANSSIQRFSIALLFIVCCECNIIRKMVKFATTLSQKSGVIATHGIQNQKHKKQFGNLNLQPTTVHIQVQQGKNGQQQISLQPNDFGTNIVTNEMQGNNGVVHLQSPSHLHKATLLTQNIKIQQSPTNIQVKDGSLFLKFS